MTKLVVEAESAASDHSFRLGRQYDGGRMRTEEGCVRRRLDHIGASGSLNDIEMKPASIASQEAKCSQHVFRYHLREANVAESTVRKSRQEALQRHKCSTLEKVC